MKKYICFLIIGFALTLSVSANARSIKLGGADIGGAHSNGMNINTHEGGISPECAANADCSADKECKLGSCSSPCSPNPCSPNTPVCKPINHIAKCYCSTSSCPAAKKCAPTGGCTNCSAGESCKCPSPQVSDGYGNCILPACPAGQIRINGTCQSICTGVVCAAGYKPVAEATQCKCVTTDPNGCNPGEVYHRILKKCVRDQQICHSTCRKCDPYCVACGTNATLNGDGFTCSCNSGNSFVSNTEWEYRSICCPSGQTWSLLLNKCVQNLNACFSESPCAVCGPHGQCNSCPSRTTVSPDGYHCTSPTPACPQFQVYHPTLKKCVPAVCPSGCRNGMCDKGYCEQCDVGYTMNSNGGCDEDLIIPHPPGNDTCDGTSVTPTSCSSGHVRCPGKGCCLISTGGCSSASFQCLQCLVRTSRPDPVENCPTWDPETRRWLECRIY